MKRYKSIICLGIIFTIFSTNTAFARLGDFGFFGGISQGRMLPKTTEQILIKNGTSKEEDDIDEVYKEVIFLSGQPVTFEGMLNVSQKDGVSDTETSGEYDVTYKVSPSATTDANASITRNLKYIVQYRKEGNQVIKDYDVDSWTETINLAGGSYTLDQDQSYSNVSVIEDKTPGVTYYKGNISHKAIYTLGEDKVTMEMSGTFYGYNCAWSETETHRIDCTVNTKDWQMQYQLRPSVSVGKTLQYEKNEPTAISFSGNYREVMQNKSGLNYDIYVMPSRFSNSVANKGNVSIDSYNSFEQLISPNVDYLKGHFAEDDIRKLFSMQILDGEPKFYQPSQAITRGQYMEALVKAIKLPIEETNSNARNRRKPTTVNIVFSDVLPERKEYPYIMAAYKAGLAVGRDNGRFAIDEPIERQEAIVILLRTLGLENLGLDPTPVTSFTDDRYIDDWAKREIYAANRIGIIYPDAEGKFNPKTYVSKADAAAFINRLNTYMRTDLQTDYTEHIVNYSN